MIVLDVLSFLESLQMKKKLVIIHYYRYDSIELTTRIGSRTTISCVCVKTNVQRQNDNRTDIEMRSKAIKLNKNDYGTAIIIVIIKKRKITFFILMNIIVLVCFLTLPSQVRHATM